MPQALLQPFPMLSGRRAQVWQHHPQFLRPRHFHAEPELNVVTRGIALLAAGAETHLLGPGEAVYFEPGQDHALLHASLDLELFVLAVTPALWERAAASERFSPRPGPSRPSPRAEAPQATRDLAGELLELGQQHDGVAVETRLTEAFVRLRAAAGSVSALTRRAAEQVRAEPGVAQNALAQRLGTHPTLLSRVFRRDLGLPLVELRARARLFRFIELVDAGQSLTRAALEADFGSYAQCHRVFRRATGLSPRAYFEGARRTLDAAVMPR